MGRYTRTWKWIWEPDNPLPTDFNEVLGFEKTYAKATELAKDCEHFLAIPVMVKQTRWDKFLRRYRVVCNSKHLSDGFVWESIE